MVCYLIPIFANYFVIRLQIVNDLLSIIFMSPGLYYHPFSFLSTVYFSNPYRRATLAMIRRLPGGKFVVGQLSIEPTQLTIAARRRTTIVPGFQATVPEEHMPSHIARKRLSKIFFIRMT
jgi:hypothetical protein